MSLGFRWDFARRHSIGLTWFSINRDAGGVFEEPIEFLELVLVGGYDSRFDVDYYGLEYRYSLINNNRADAGFSLGVSTFDFAVAIEGDAYVIGDIPTQPQPGVP